MKLKKVFEPNGLLDKHFPEYEQRAGQIKMAELVESAIDKGQSAVIEGATGVGKSFAYLVPAILSGKSIIISTSHKSLQDQLSNKDLPTLKKILPVDFDWTVLKGRINYFCHEHFRTNKQEIIKYYRDKEGLSFTEAKLKLKEILQWADKTDEGDVEFYPDDLPYRVKELITCKTTTVHDKESGFYNLCFANLARARVKKTKIILVNHTLLALDLALKAKTDGKAKILPNTGLIIIDEAHTFEKYSSMAFSDSINIYTLHHLLQWRIVKKSVSDKDLQELYKAFSVSLRRFLPKKGTTYYQQTKYTKFDGFEKVIDGIYKVLKKINNNERLKKDSVTLSKMKEIRKEVENLIDRLETLGIENDNMLRWSEARDSHVGDPIITLKSVPINLSGILKKILFENNVVICTSATLSVNRNFEFFRYQVGVPESALELIVDSPFNFKTNALIYISNGDHEKIYEIQELLKYSKGRAFVLFTSYKDMNYCYDAVDIPYPKLLQGNGISRSKLLKEFRETPNAVLFATKSFWEGVDVRGDELMMVIIHKIPFENPRNLLYASKIEKIDKILGQGKHWTRFTIPDACLKLKQGVGRLIRSKTDVGIIAILDSRINYQNYGKTVVASFPPAYRTQKLERVKRFYERIYSNKKSV